MEGEREAAEADATYDLPRNRAYSKLMAFEAARLLAHMGCDVRVYSPAGLPLKDGEHRALGLDVALAAYIDH